MTAPLTPSVAVDIIIEMTDRPDRPIVLIERRNPPHGWALPGGFVDIGETVEAAALREACEETSLAVTLDCLLGVYSDPARDPRGHTISPVYVARACGQPQAADDARRLGIFDPHDCPPLVFDHEVIIADYIGLREHGSVAPLRLPVADNRSDR